jgi:hypothetical protein
MSNVDCRISIIEWRMTSRAYIHLNEARVILSEARVILSEARVILSEAKNLLMSGMSDHTRDPSLRSG